MVKKGANWQLWAKMLGAGVIVCVGGPAFTLWVTPTEEELFKKYNPELQKRSLEGRYERQKEFDDFVSNLKRLSKSEKSSMSPNLCISEFQSNLFCSMVCAEG
ncbi:CBP4-domain-containing protein [Cercophora newfieldiana]|uniref:Cytochrome b mRNA-processing protein 4 n=1 Tax=Cercophora newfieldiana TaxID=92897 RepID=A0AA39YNH1_9PEZI|nr:CBP4-domain-containing protein [Cercophora newfieldiana]